MNVEVLQTFKGQQLSLNYYRGSRLIDAIWCTKDVAIENACALLFGYVIENHQAFVVNFHKTSLVGINLQPIVHPKSKQLMQESLEVLKCTTHL